MSDQSAEFDTLRRIRAQGRIPHAAPGDPLYDPPRARPRDVRHDAQLAIDTQRASEGLRTRLLPPPGRVSKHAKGRVKRRA